MGAVQGLDRLKRKLDRMPRKAVQRMRESLDSSADQLIQAQRALAQGSRQTGKLIEGIVKEPGVHELQILVKSLAFYSLHVEFGTVQASAQPFFWPGYRLMRKKIKSRARSAASKAVKEAIVGA